MENKNKLENERWVEARLALLAAPDGWEPDAGAARTRLQGRLSARRPTLARHWLLRAAVIVLACLVLLFAIPKTRALTQQLWQWLTVQKVEVVQGDFEKLRGPWLFPQIRIEIEEREVSDEEVPDEGGHPEPEKGIVMPESLDFPEVVERAGFTPRLPHEGVPLDRPNLMVWDPMVWSITLNAADLETSLRQAGVDDQPIPTEWDGAQISIHIGSAVVASWNGGTALMQYPPLTLSAPAGFDFMTYWMAALRAAGVDREQARQWAERVTKAPTLLLGIRAKNKTAIREVNLRTGPATLIEHVGKTGRVEHFSLIWSTADRIYHLSAASEEEAIKAANSIE